MTQCTPKQTLLFHPQKRLDITFDAPEISSDGGVLLLRILDDRLGLSLHFAACLPDQRDPSKVKHPRVEQLRQRLYQIALGYEDANDADRLRQDPLLKTACDRSVQQDEGLSSQPTLSRFENALRPQDLRRLRRTLETQYLESLDPDAEVVILDIDSTADPTHGAQQMALFNGHHRTYMFHPLLVFDGCSGQLISPILRGGRAHASRGAVGLLSRLIRKIRRRCPLSAIVVRGDSHFATPRILRVLERLDRTIGGVDYLFGMGKNERLLRRIEPTMQEAKRGWSPGQTVALYTDFDYAAGSWPRKRWIIGKAQWTWMGPNPRFLVTSIRGFDPETLYRAYCERGQCENWIKDFKNALHADRLSCPSFTANCFRLLLHAMAYRLMHALRDEVAATGSQWARAQFDTLRLRLFKVAVVVKESVRRIHANFSSSFGEQRLFRALLDRLSPQLPAPAT